MVGLQKHIIQAENSSHQNTPLKLIMLLPSYTLYSEITVHLNILFSCDFDS